MTTRDNDDDCRLGFLAAIEVPERGYVGGLLVTNRFGRPLEFQCTTPVKPNRTQEILYGPTLVPFVLGELIGRTLLEKVGVKPHVVLTEAPEILEVRKHVSLPVACIEAARKKAPPANTAPPADTAPDATVADPQSSATDGSSDAPAPSPPAGSTAEPQSTVEDVGSVAPKSPAARTLRFHAAHQADREAVEGQIAALPREVDLHEPFERVREALEETTRAGTPR